MSKPLISFCAGTFDGLDGCHIGHKFLLSKMRALVGPKGRVMVGLNFDEYIRDYKKREPLSSWKRRERALYGTGSVDEVFGFYCNPIDLIMRFKPMHLFVGSDYSEEKIIGATEVKSWGGSVVIIPRVPNVSTSEIISKLNEQAK